MSYTAINLFMRMRATTNQSKHLLFVGSSCFLGMAFWILNFIHRVMVVESNINLLDFPAIILTLGIDIVCIAIGFFSLMKNMLNFFHLLYASFWLTIALFANYIIDMYRLYNEFNLNPSLVFGSFVIILCMFILTLVILFYPSRFHKGNAYFLKVVSTFMMTGAIIQGQYLLRWDFPADAVMNNQNALVQNTSFLMYLLFFVSVLIVFGLLISSIIISRKLAKSDSYLRDIRFALDQSSIVAITDPNGIITYANDKFIEISKYSKEELLGQSHSIINSGYHPKEFFSDLWKTIKEGKTWTGEICNRNKLGELYWVATTIVPFMKNGKPYQYIAIRTDITNRKKAEEMLHQQDKLAAVGQLAAGVAHEIRNPLTSMKGYTEFLHSEEKDPNRIEFFEIILDEIDRVNQIVEEFLVLAKPQSVQLETKNIIPIIRNVLSLMEFDARKKNVTFYFESAHDSILVRCDENRLKQVFLNFVKNGIEAMPSGGKIMVRIELKEGEVQISIEDTGVGIPPERLKKLGEPFYTTKKTGNGLGLMVSFKIIEGHKGRIVVESEVNKGTTFNILLPADIA
jgi:PAS domain S-box-containing protein